MNAKRSHSTLRGIVLLLAGALLSVPLHAQGDAQVYGKFTSGEFRTPSEGSQLWTAGAKASAETLKRGFSFNGHFGFEFTYGDKMMGSMFTSPGYYPVDVLEFTPGPKTKQTYEIGGGLSWHNRSQWVPSLQASFKGINYAKRKDLRHTTYRQEAGVAPSILYEGGSFSIGAGYLLEKTSEFVQAEQVGSATAESYYAFLDKGQRYGTYQVWNGSGTHLAESGVDRFPVKEIANGAALQAQVGPVEAEASCRFYSGIVGEKGFTWFRFPGAKVESSLRWNLETGAGSHLFQADYQWRSQTLYETVLDRETSGGVTTPVIYGENRIQDHRYFEVVPSWRFESRKGWKLWAQVNVNHDRMRSTLLYPFIDYDESTHMTVETGSEIPLGRFLLTVSLSGHNKVGEHSHVVDRDDDNLGVSAPPFRLQEWWDMEQEVQDASTISGNLRLRYTFAGKLPFYLEASCEMLKAFKVQKLPGSFRQTTCLSLGYNF